MPKRHSKKSNLSLRARLIVSGKDEALELLDDESSTSINPVLVWNCTSIARQWRTACWNYSPWAQNKLQENTYNLNC